MSDKIKDRQKTLAEEIEKNRQYYFDEVIKLRNNLISHLLGTAEVSSVDSRHE